MKISYKEAAYSGIAILVLSFLSILISFIPAVTSIPFLSNIIDAIFGITIVLLSIAIYSVYLTTSKKYNANLLKVMSIIGIVVNIIFLAFTLLGFFISGFSLASAQDNLTNNTLSTNPIDNLFYTMEDNDIFSTNEWTSLILIFLIFIFIFILMISAYYVLFGFGLLKLKDDVPFSKETAVTYIIAGFTFIIAIGFLVLLVAKIFEIIMFFKASETIEVKNKRMKS